MLHLIQFPCYLIWVLKGINYLVIIMTFLPEKGTRIRETKEFNLSRGEQSSDPETYGVIVE